MKRHAAIVRYCAVISVLLATGVSLASTPTPASADSVVSTITVPGANTGVFKVAVNAATNRVYVTQNVKGSLLVIDGNTDAIIATIPMPSGPNGEAPDPHGVAVNEQTNRIYVVNGHNLTVVDGASNTVVANAPLDRNGSPIPVAVNPQTNRVYVGLWSYNTVLVFDTTTVVPQQDASLTVGKQPVSLAVHRPTNRIYAVNSYENSVSVINGTTNSVTAEKIPVGVHPHEIAINPGTNRAYVTNTSNTGNIPGIPPSPNTNSVSVIDLSTNMVIATIQVGTHPGAVTVNPTSNRIYAVNSLSSNVSVIDGATNAVIKTIPVGSSPSGAAANPTTARAYVANQNANSVSVIGNAAPSAGSITAPTAPVAVGTAVNASATFTDADSEDSHAATWTWDDGSTSAGTVSESNGSGSVTGSHTYTAAGVYTVKLAVKDPAGSTSQTTFQYVVVYDPSGGFVTGGGWITSLAGACQLPTACQGSTGRANFGFVSRYQPGRTEPTGQTEFDFKAGNLNFHSASYEWLVVAGARAQYKGTGTINGAGSYGFLLTAVDGALPGGNGSDKFRIKIWNKVTNAVVYDNQTGATDDAEPTTVIGGGSIVIHK